jgi:hypothetical protein
MCCELFNCLFATLHYRCVQLLHDIIFIARTPAHANVLCLPPKPCSQLFARPLA